MVRVVAVGDVVAVVLALLPLVAGDLQPLLDGGEGVERVPREVQTGRNLQVAG